ncbi:PAS domain S-box protein [Methanosarcina sp.]|uniref:PAS domain S-box protein n=1 Tax=Methanosarcina sp. TaxID=2213 RepID=UPI003C747F1F
MKNDNENSGIDNIRNVPWGAHFCQFYQTKEDLMDIVIPLLKTGLKNNEACIWIISQPQEVEETKEALKATFPDIEIFLRKGQIEIISCDNWFIKDGTFDSQRALDGLTERIDRALASNYTGLRLIEDICRLEKESWNGFVDYERKVDSAIHRHPVTVLCTYSLEIYNSAEILDIIANHQFALTKREGKWEQIESIGRKNPAECRRAEQALQESEEKDRRLFEVMQEAFFIADIITDETGKPVDYHILEANQALETQTGVQLEKFIGNTALGMYPGLDPFWIQTYGRVALTGKPAHFTYYADVQGRHYEVSAYQVQPGRFAAIFLDITDRKRAEEALRASEARYRSLYENSLDGIMLTRPDGTILSANPQACYLFGMTEEEIRQVGREGVVVRDEKLAAALKERELTGRMKAELTCRRKDGSTFVCDTTSNLFVDADGSMKTSTIIRDITERKQLEGQTRLRAEETEKIMEVVPVPILIGHDPQGHNITGNRMASEFYEVETGDNISASVTEARRFFYKGRALTADELPIEQAALKDTDVRDMEIDMLLPSGKWKVITMSASPLHDAEGHVRGSVAAFMDLTERKQAEEALRKSEERYRVLFTNMTDGFGLVEVIYDRNGKPYDYRYLELNPAFELILGVKREQLLGRTMLEVFPNAAPVAIEKYSEVALSGKPAHFEIFSQIANRYLDIYAFSPEKGKLALIIRDVTERKKIEKDLQESEEKYRNIVETASEGIWIGDPEARTIYANKRLTEMLEYAPYEMIGRFAWEFADEKDKPIVKKNIERRREGIDESYEFKFIRKDCSPLWTIVSSKSLFDKDGKFTGSMSMLTDITRRKEAEAKLKETLDNLESLVKERTAELEEAYKSLEESEKRLAEAQKMAHIGHWEWDISTEESYWSDELYRIFGRNPQEPYSAYQEFLSYVHPDDRDYVISAANRAMNGKPYSIDYRIISADGKERTVHMQSEVIFDENNTPVRIKGIVQDITERKKTEEKLQHTYSRLRAFFDRKIDGIGIIIANVEGKILEANNYYLHMLRFSREELEAGVVNWLEITPPEWLQADEKAIAELREHGVSTPYEKEYLRRDGSRVPVLIANTIFPGSHGEILAFVLDITERKRTEEALANLEKIRIKEIHHRIKNNLQVISSLLDLQAETFSRLETCKTPEVVEAFMESQSRVISMSLIHEELYKGDKIDTLDFAAYLRKLTEDLFSSYKPQNKDISLKLDLEQVYLGMDAAIPLGIIVNELVSNAFKHAFSDRREGEIRINLRRVETFSFESEIIGPDKACTGENGFDYRLEVSDNGRGIPEEIDFENTDSLGLQLVNILVQQIDGCIKLERDHGAKFTIWFSDIER